MTDINTPSFTDSQHISKPELLEDLGINRIKIKKYQKSKDQILNQEYLAFTMVVAKKYYPKF